jgi:hypothetical protein
MERRSGVAITGWAAILLAPILLPLAIIVQLWRGKKGKDRTPEDVSGYLRDFLDGTGGEWDWDDFETVKITDPELDDI